MSEHPRSLYAAGGRWRRWELESFDTAGSVEPPASASSPAAADAAEATVALPDPAEVLAEIEQLRRAATTRGHAEGYAAGHSQGHEAGRVEGHAQGLEEGRQAGYAEGHAEGLELARQQAERLQQLAQACSEAIQDIEADIGDALLSLAVSIAEQVLRSTLDTQPERIVDLVRDVMQVDGCQQGVLKLRLNPEDLDLVDQFLQQDSTVTQWRLQADPAIERGGCLAETALGNIDATLQTRWQRVVSALGKES